MTPQANGQRFPDGIIEFTNGACRDETVRSVPGGVEVALKTEIVDYFREAKGKLWQERLTPYSPANVESPRLIRLRYHSETASSKADILRSELEESSIARNVPEG